MNEQATDTARVVVPVQFFKGKEEEGESPSFEKFLQERETKRTAASDEPIHPSLLGDVPDDAGDD